MSETEFATELGEWTRHYDELLWRVTTIFATADGALLIFCVEKKTDSLIPYVIGILLPPIAVYFAASFRELKNGLSLKMAEVYSKQLFFPRKLPQWEAYVAMFFLLTVAWMWLLLQKGDPFFWCGFAGGIISTNVVAVLWLFSRSQTIRVANADKGSATI